MVRSTVLVVDGEETRRRDLVRGLAAFGYEVVAAATAKEGRRFASGLKPGVIVAEGGLVDVADPFGVRAASATAREAPPTTVLLVEEETRPEVPVGIVTIPVRDTRFEAILRKVRTALLGRELGLRCDPLLESLVGDLEALPLYELLPLLQAAAVTGHVLAGDGELFLEEGEVTAARADAQCGAKAFARLARTAAGRFRVMLGSPTVPRELFNDVLSLMALAMEDQHRYEDARDRLPSLSSRVRLVTRADDPGSTLSPDQQSVVEHARAGRTLSSVLDRTGALDGTAMADAGRLHELGILEFDAPEVNVRIVTDSTADLPLELVKRHQIHIVPLSVTSGRDVYEDGVDLSPEAFYKLLESREGAHLGIGPPTKGDFLARYRMLVERSDVVSVHLSGRVSETVVNARAAAEEGMEEFRRLRGDGTAAFEVFDSMQIGAGLALLVLMAARMALRKLQAHEIRAHLERMRSRVHLLFVADKLQYLCAGGHLGKSQAWLQGMLGFKPILGLEDGEVVLVDRVRRAHAAHPRVVELFKQRVDPARPSLAGIGHAGCPVQAVRLRNLLQDSFTVSELIESETGPVVGTQLGPGCVAAAIFQPTEEERPLVAPVTDAW
jgi:DegV family protein with EDD domain